MCWILLGGGAIIAAGGGAIVNMGSTSWMVGQGGMPCYTSSKSAVLGLTRGAGRAHIVRAALESIAYQTRDLMEALGGAKAALRVDGGAAANDFLMQFQADLLGVNVLRPSNLETTAQGAAYLAGLATGYWSGFDEIREFRKIDRIFEPKLDQTARDDLYKHWQAAVRRVRTN